jgi:hypothetical protein
VLDRLHRPSGTTVVLRVLAATLGLETAPDAAIRRATEQACVVGYRRRPIYVRSGGTIPAVGMLARAFAVSPLLLGFGMPGGRAHGPDEGIDLTGWAAAVDTSAALLEALAPDPYHSGHADRQAREQRRATPDQGEEDSWP